MVTLWANLMLVFVPGMGGQSLSHRPIDVGLVPRQYLSWE